MICFNGGPSEGLPQIGLIRLMHAAIHKRDVPVPGNHGMKSRAPSGQVGAADLKHSGTDWPGIRDVSIAGEDVIAVAARSVHVDEIADVPIAERPEIQGGLPFLVRHASENLGCFQFV